MQAPTSDPQLLGRLRADLAAANFSVDALEQLWGTGPGAALLRGQRVPVLRALAKQPGALATLAKLFLLGQHVSDAELTEALPSLRVAGAAELSLVTPTGEDAFRASVDLRPYSFVGDSGTVSWWIASDLGELASGRSLHEDHVLGVGGASNTLTALMFRSPVASALDLGTGCGIQALHAAQFAEHVVATDLSLRALEFARFNAALNGVDNIEFCHGSLFEPLGDERFDRIISNPPFVITPQTDAVPHYEYRDGGLVGDRLVAQVLGGLAKHLNPGGDAQLLANWEYPQGGDGLTRAGRMLQGQSLHSWVVERERLEVREYAETWIRDGGLVPATPAFDSLYDTWLNDFEARNITAVGFGYVVVRKATEQEERLAILERVGTSAAAGSGALGDYFEHALSESIQLCQLSDEDVLAATYVCEPSVTEERHHLPGEESPSAILLAQGNGLGRRIPVGTEVAAFVGACDGTLSAQVICKAIASLLELSGDEVARSLVGEIRALVRAGMLVMAAEHPVG